MYCTNGSESYTRQGLLPASTVCLALTNIIPLSTVQRKKLKHLKLPLIYGMYMSSCFWFCLIYLGILFTEVKYLVCWNKCRIDIGDLWPAHLNFHSALLGFIHLVFRNINYFLTRTTAEVRNIAKKIVVRVRSLIVWL